MIKDKVRNFLVPQQQEVREAREIAEKGLNNTLLRYYRTVFIPAEEGFSERELGAPTVSVERNLDEIVYDHLQAEGDILGSLQPMVIKEMYLNNTPYVRTEQLYRSSATTRGALRVSGSDAWESGIRQGVELGHFGLGQLVDGEPVYQYFKKKPSDVSLSGNEVILRADLCIDQKNSATMEQHLIESDGDADASIKTEGNGNLLRRQTGQSEESVEKRTQEVLKEVPLKFIFPRGQKVSDLLSMIAFLQSKFKTLNIDLLATDGEMSEQEYEDNIGETVVQLGIKLK